VIGSSKLYKKLSKISGWLSRVDYEVFCTLLEYQIKAGYHGSIVEIGTHHGKSFVPMALSNECSNTYVIDIFENQQNNIDFSGSGSRDIFLKTMSYFSIATDKIFIDARMSTDVSQDDIEEKVGKSRFFHIDGGHHLEAIINDVNLAFGVIKESGIIAIDDVFRPEWPEVSMGVFGVKTFKENDFVPFAIGFNKTYWCNTKYVKEYQNSLLENKKLAALLRKTYDVMERKLIIFQTYPLPEWPIWKRIHWYLELYHPDMAMIANPTLRTVKTSFMKFIDKT
jgi:hypothetical protein